MIESFPLLLKGNACCERYACSQLSNYDSFVTFKILLIVSKHIVTCFMSSISLTIAIIFIILQFQHMNDSNK